MLENQGKLQLFSVQIPMTLPLLSGFLGFVCYVCVNEGLDEVGNKCNSPAQQWEGEPRETACKQPDEEQHNIDA